MALTEFQRRICRLISRHRLETDERIQRLGYLAWAASGKDPGFSPSAILEQAGRSARYSKSEIGALSFAGSPPEPSKLSQSWHAMLIEARELVEMLPPDEIGKCVLDFHGNLYSGDPGELRQSLKEKNVAFHEGRIYGAFPVVRNT